MCVLHRCFCPTFRPRRVICHICGRMLNVNGVTAGGSECGTCCALSFFFFETCCICLLLLLLLMLLLFVVRGHVLSFHFACPTFGRPQFWLRRAVCVAIGAPVCVVCISAFDAAAGSTTSSRLHILLRFFDFAKHFIIFTHVCFIAIRLELSFVFGMPSLCFCCARFVPSGCGFKSDIERPNRKVFSRYASHPHICVIRALVCLRPGRNTFLCAARSDTLRSGCHRGLGRIGAPVCLNCSRCCCDCFCSRGFSRDFTFAKHHVMLGFATVEHSSWNARSWTCRCYG